MKKVVVIIGGGSGIGLATAKHMSKDKIIVIASRTLLKLERAVEELHELGYEAYCKTCDIIDRNQVRELAEYCSSLGEITNLINSAGLSAGMIEGDPSILYKVNSLGTVHVVEEFEKHMKSGSVIVCLASLAAYIAAKLPISTKKFLLAETDEELFIKKNMLHTKIIKDEYDAALVTYAFSKKFVIWYVERCAFALGKKGIRIVSVSPGYIDTSMGRLELARAGHIGIVDNTTNGRMGTAEEAGYAVATIADEKNGYIAGVDILMDGGFCLNERRLKDRNRFK